MGGVAADPVETGLVSSLAHPGGNITGMSMMTADLGGKRLELNRTRFLWTPSGLRLTAAKEAGHEGQGAKAHHDSWQ